MFDPAVSVNVSVNESATGPFPLVVAIVEKMLLVLPIVSTGFAPVVVKVVLIPLPAAIWSDSVDPICSVAELPSTAVQYW
jgi:hypothetical protein